MCLQVERTEDTVGVWIIEFMKQPGACRHSGQHTRQVVQDVGSIMVGWQRMVLYWVQGCRIVGCKISRNVSLRVEDVGVHRVPGGGGKSNAGAAKRSAFAAFHSRSHPSPSVPCQAHLRLASPPCLAPYLFEPLSPNVPRPCGYRRRRSSSGGQQGMCAKTRKCCQGCFVSVWAPIPAAPIPSGQGQG